MKNRVFIIISIYFFPFLCLAQNNHGKEYLQKGNALYEAGHYDLAVNYYLKAAKFDEVEAMFNLGYAFYHGEGIIQDFPSAAMWFKRAANLQYPKAEYNLAFCYMNGKGVPCDYDKALNLLISSANHGFSQAQLTLAECYERGVLVEQNIEESQNMYLFLMQKKIKFRQQSMMKFLEKKEYGAKYMMKMHGVWMELPPMPDYSRRHRMYAI